MPELFGQSFRKLESDGGGGWQGIKSTSERARVVEQKRLGGGREGGRERRGRGHEGDGREVSNTWRLRKKMLSEREK